MTTSQVHPAVDHVSGQEFRMLIDGEMAGAPSREVMDPSTGNVLAVVPDATPDDVSRAVAAAQRARPEWEALGVAGRAACFQRFGVMGDYFADRGHVTSADYGRYNVTKQESDRYVFRVPSLRNVELTAPYFHDGSAETLEQAVEIMAKYQLGRPLSGEDVARIVAFLKTLTGQAPDASRFVTRAEGSRG